MMDVKPFVCTYYKGDKQIGLTLYGENAEAIMNKFGPHFERLEVEGQFEGSETFAKQEPKAGRFVKFDREKHLVYAEVYLPDIEDAHGHCMDRDEIEKMAHGFMKNARTTFIDLNHDNNTDYGCYMVESFIARDNDPDYYPGSWVAAVKVENPEIWQKIRDGEITGFSFEGMGYLVETDR